jgi:hypothetical protein
MAGASETTEGIRNCPALFSGFGVNLLPSFTAKSGVEKTTPLWVYNYFLSPKRSMRERYLSISISLR